MIDTKIGHCLVTPDQFIAWVGQAQKGDRLRYFEGLLSAEVCEERETEAADLRRATQISCAGNLVCLVQKRRFPFGYHYYAVRTEKNK